MADESLEDRDPRSEPSDQRRHDDEDGRSNRSSSRRRMMVASLLTAPAVMTLGARAARSQIAQTQTKRDSPSCAASINPSHHCT
jgi:hypothetical protein